MTMEQSLSSCPSTSLFSRHYVLQTDKALSSFAAAKLPPAGPSSRRLLVASVVPSSVAAWLAGNLAYAVSYDEVAISVPSVQAPTDVDIGAIAESVSKFVTENPVAVIAGVAAVALPLVVSSLFSQGKPWSAISAKEAFKKLETEDAQLLDIRSSNDIKMEGTPDLRALKKRVYQIAYAAGDEGAFVKKLLAKFKEPSQTTICILDQFDGNSLSVAKLITASGFKNAYAIKGGAEGPNGWRSNKLPWILPRKGFTLDISGLKDVIDSTFSDNRNLVPATLGVAAAAGVSLVVFSEAETALQILGSAALIQLFVKKFLFAKERQKTLQELQAFLDTKIAPKEVVDELKGLGRILLPKYDVVPARSTNGAAAIAESSQSEVQSEGGAVGEQVKYEDVEASKEEESAPLASAASTDVPPSATPLSPYTQYPGLKPPSFSTPSKP